MHARGTGSCTVVVPVAEGLASGFPSVAAAGFAVDAVAAFVGCAVAVVVYAVALFFLGFHFPCTCAVGCSVGVAGPNTIFADAFAAGFGVACVARSFVAGFTERACVRGVTTLLVGGAFGLGSPHRTTFAVTHALLKVIVVEAAGFVQLAGCRWALVGDALTGATDLTCGAVGGLGVFHQATFAVTNAGFVLPWHGLVVCSAGLVAFFAFVFAIGDALLVLATFSGLARLRVFARPPGRVVLARLYARLTESACVGKALLCVVGLAWNAFVVEGANRPIAAGAI